MTDARPAPAVPPIRRMDFEFTEDIPRWWLGGDRTLTRNVDALHMLFPEGERFFIRSVRHYYRALDDLELQARVKGFMGQEVMHGREHEAAFALLERHGIEYRSFLEGPGRGFFQFLEAHTTPLTRLAVTCALEHLTAIMGAGALTDGLLDDAHPTMRSLALWHAAEEIEHKSVAFDVYKAVGGGYMRRVLGMVVAYAGLLWCWRAAARHLLEQDGGYSELDMARLRQRLADQGVTGPRQIHAAIIDYLRPNFHPDDHDTAHLAAAYLHGRTEAA